MAIENVATQAEEAGLVIAEMFPDPSERWIVLKQLIVSTDYAETVAPNAWGVTLYSNIFRMNVGRVEVFVAGSEFVRLNCVGVAGRPPFVGPRFERPGYRSVPDPKCAFVGPIDEFALVEADLQPYHKDFIGVVGRRKSGEPVAGSSATKSHCEGLIVYARAFLSSPERAADVEAVWTAEDESLPDVPLTEGKQLTLQVNAYERNAVARASCIHHYGSSCIACGFSAADKYGPNIAGLIHIHHLRALSEIGAEYVVDPVADLRPVCPNCHAVIHSRHPPYEIEEVAAMMRNASTAQRVPPV